MKEIFANLKTASLAAVLLTVLLCGAYPAAVGFLGRGLFPDRAGGSLIKSDAGIVGSELLARGFSGERFFHPRPSAAGEGFDALRSGGSNRGPLSRDLEEAVRVRVEAYRAENSLPDGIPVPADAVTIVDGRTLQFDIAGAAAGSADYQLAILRLKSEVAKAQYNLELEMGNQRVAQTILLV